MATFPTLCPWKVACVVRRGRVAATFVAQDLKSRWGGTVIYKSNQLALEGAITVLAFFDLIV
jgi:hypothetical protein